MKKNIEISIIIVSIIFSLLLLLFVINPAVTGYTVYKEMQGKNVSFEDYEINLQLLENNINNLNKTILECNSQKENLQAKNQIIQNSLDVCQSKLDKISILQNITITNYEKEIAGKKALIESNQKDMIILYSENKILSDKLLNLESVQQDYNSLIQNVANNVCCKAKVDNSKINSFNVEKNMVVCVESGSNRINC